MHLLFLFYKEIVSIVLYIEWGLEVLITLQNAPAKVKLGHIKPHFYLPCWETALFMPHALCITGSSPTMHRSILNAGDSCITPA